LAIVRIRSPSSASEAFRYLEGKALLMFMDQRLLPMCE
jgi:hypothetical protein